MSDFAEWRPCRVCGLPVALPKRVHDECAEQTPPSSPKAPGEPMSDERLAEIRKHIDEYERWPMIANTYLIDAQTDRLDLLAEVERLRTRCKEYRRQLALYGVIIIEDDYH